MNSIVLAIAILSVAYGVTTRSHLSLDEPTLLVQIRTAMETKGPISDIFTMLDQLTGEIMAEQIEHDTLAAQQKTDCDDEFAFRDGEIQEAEFAKERADNERKRCGDALNRSKKLLENNLAEQVRINKELENAHNTREHEKLVYSSRTVDHDDLVGAIDECIDLMETLKDDASPATLLQINNKAKNLFKAGHKARKAATIAPVIMGMVQVAKHSDQGAVARLIELFIELRENTVNSQVDYDQQELTAQKMYNQLVVDLNAELDRLTGEQTTLEAHIVDMQACFDLQNATFNEASDKLDRNHGLLADAKNMCADWFSEYESETAGRNEELSLIADVRAICENRFGSFENTASERADQKTEEWEPYTNQYVYSSGKNFASEGGDFNESGASGAGYARDAEFEG